MKLTNDIEQQQIKGNYKRLVKEFNNLYKEFRIKDIELINLLEILIKTTSDEQTATIFRLETENIRLKQENENLKALLKNKEK